MINLYNIRSDPNESSHNLSVEHVLGWEDYPLPISIHCAIFLYVILEFGG